MPQVDFFVLAGDDPSARRLYTCRLAEKAWKAGHKVFIRASDTTEAALLDELLWTFRQGSFVPHALAGNQGDDPLVPVLIGVSQAPEGFHDFLINLAADIPPDWRHFQRIAEIVDADPGVRQAGRDKYRSYQSQDIKPATHKIH